LGNKFKGWIAIQPFIPWATFRFLLFLPNVPSDKKQRKNTPLRLEDNFDAVVFFMFENLVGMGGVLDIQAMGNDEGGVNITVLNAF
jgi:hypothetical protein